MGGRRLEGVVERERLVTNTFKKHQDHRNPKKSKKIPIWHWPYPFLFISDTYLLSVERRYGVLQTGETVLDVISALSLQCVVVRPLIGFRVELLGRRVRQALLLIQVAVIAVFGVREIAVYRHFASERDGVESGGVRWSQVESDGV